MESIISDRDVLFLFNGSELDKWRASVDDNLRKELENDSFSEFQDLIDKVIKKWLELLKLSKKKSHIIKGFATQKNLRTPSRKSEKISEHLKSPNKFTKSDTEKTGKNPRKIRKVREKKSHNPKKPQNLKKKSNKKNLKSPKKISQKSEKIPKSDK